MSLSACFCRFLPLGEMNVGPLVIICLVQTDRNVSTNLALNAVKFVSCSPQD